MKKFLLVLCALICTVSILDARRFSYGRSSRSYTKKTAYAGMGKTSKVNGLIKTKGISGHGKRTRSRGYTYVAPYVRSK